MNLHKKDERKDASDDLTVGQVAKRAGVAISALHFYESKGLITARRNDGNQRRFSRAVLRFVSIIKVAQSLGFSLREIKKALSVLPKNDVPSNQQWSELGKIWKKDLDQRIQRLTKLRNQLDGCIGCGCLATKSCPLRNPEDKLAKKGPGAHLLE